jgi:hypothetical protein
MGPEVPPQLKAVPSTHFPFGKTVVYSGRPELRSLIKITSASVSLAGARCPHYSRKPVQIIFMVVDSLVRTKGIRERLRLKNKSQVGAGKGARSRVSGGLRMRLMTPRS